MPELKAELLHLIATDPAVRAALREAVEGTSTRAMTVQPRVEAPPSEPAYTGPAWLAPKAARGGPHTRGRFGINSQ